MTVRLTLVGTASGQLLLRAVNLLAQRDLLPQAMDMRVEDGELRLRLDFAGAVDPVVIAKLGMLVELRDLTVARLPERAPAD